MPTAKFLVEVSVSESVQSTSRDEAVANVVKYLAYADQTELFGYHGKIEKVTCKKKHRNAYGSVEFTFSAPVAHPSDLMQWRDEMDRLARVESYECISNPMNPNL